MNTHKNHLKDYRIKQKLTPAQLGELAGVSRQTIFLIEENLYSPSVRLAAKFADIFNTTIDSLFTHTLEEEKAKESKHIYLKFFTLIIICGFLGGLAGFLLNYPGFDIVDSVQLLQNNILDYGLYISSAGSVVLMLITALFYLSARNTYRQLETNDSDALYEKADHLCDTGIIFGNITLIFTFAFYGINVSGIHNNSSTSLLWALAAFLLPVIFCVIFQILFVNLTKNPEKQGNPLDLNFKKIWMNSNDEAEKFILYKAAYKTFQIMQMAFLIVMVLLMFAALTTPIGAFPFMIIGILWGLQSTLCCIFSMNLQKSKKIDSDDC